MRVCVLQKWDHVLPLSLPGILTGTILGLATALG
jgi:phosphate transport system permease protein